MNIYTCEVQTYLLMRLINKLIAYAINKQVKKLNEIIERLNENENK